MHDDYLLFLSVRVREKIRDLHDVELQEIEEAFFTSLEPYPKDQRIKHHPDSRSFFGFTSDNRLLKVVFLPKDDKKILFVLTAYDPDENDKINYKLKGGLIDAE